jgi:hypothetical protein
VCLPVHCNGRCAESALSAVHFSMSAPPAAATTSATSQHPWGLEFAKLFVSPTSICAVCKWDYVDKFASLSGHGYCLNQQCFRSEASKNAKQARKRQHHDKGKGKGTWHNWSEPWHGKGIDHDKGKGVKGNNYAKFAPGTPAAAAATAAMQLCIANSSRSSHDQQQLKPHGPPLQHQQQQQQATLLRCDWCDKSTGSRIQINRIVNRVGPDLSDRSSIWVCERCHDATSCRDERKTPPWRKKRNNATLETPPWRI